MFFDVEGVLVPKHRYLLFEMGRLLSFTQFLKVAFYGVLYKLGLVSVKYALEGVCRAFRGFRVDMLLEVFRAVPLIAGVEEVFKRIRERGWKIALVSSGLPDFVVQDLARRLGADYGIGFNLEVEEGVVTGRVSGDVLEPHGKLVVLRRILEIEGLNPRDCIVVADDRNNAPMMLSEALKIGFHPDFMVRIRADHVVTGSLMEILPLMGIGEPRAGAYPSGNEVIREFIHACGILVPLLSSLVGLSPVVLLIFAVVLLYSISEWAMMKGGNVPIFSQIIRMASTHVEAYGFASAPVFFALGILFTLILFPAPVSGGAVAVFAFGDSAAAFFGKAFGRKTLPFGKGKTLEGSIAGFLLGFLGALFFVDPFKALAGAAVAMFIESLPLPVNDNLTIPLAAAVTMVLVG